MWLGIQISAGVCERSDKLSFEIHNKRKVLNEDWRGNLTCDWYG